MDKDWQEKILVDKVKECNKDIKRIQEYRDEFESVLAHLPNLDDLDFYWSTWLWGTTQLNFPLDKQLIKEVCNRFVQTNWRETKQSTEAWGFRIRYALTEEVNGTIELHFNKSHAAATCFLNPIGEKLVSEKIYEVVCQDAMEESV